MVSLTTGIGTSYDYGTVAYDVATGRIVWTHIHDGPGEGNDYVSAVAASPDGSAFVIEGPGGIGDPVMVPAPSVSCIR